MKFLKLLILLVIFSVPLSRAQSSTNNDQLFAQGMFDIQDSSDVVAVEADLRNHPNVAVVRLDAYSNRFFILTKDISALSEADLKSWFGEASEKLNCIQIGIHGVDLVRPFPFTDCPNN